MLHYRTFQNTDPPAIADLWQSRAGQPGMAQPVSVELLEQLVFAKLYFDYQGLILAFDGSRLEGFAHAGFGPNEARDRLSTETGVTCVLVVRPGLNQAEAAEGLLERCEAYLRRRGATVIYGGGIEPFEPFYLGLYGGSALPGVLDSDAAVQQLYRARGYQLVDRCFIFRCGLADFRPVVDRRQMSLRRRMLVEADAAPKSRNWWEAHHAADFDCFRYELVPQGGRNPVAHALFRSTELYGSNLERSLGLIELEVDPRHRQQGAATLLLGESLRRMAKQGTQTVEAQTTERNTPCIGLLRKLGLELAAQGAAFRKTFA